MVHQVIPILQVYDLKASVDFYENNLSFTAHNTGSCIILKNGNSEIQLQYTNNKKNWQPASCCFYVSNIQDLYSGLSSKDLVLPVGKLKVAAFGTKEFFIYDNSGNTLYFREQKQL